MRNCQTGKYSAESQKILNEISTAKVCLLNAEKKAAYDQRLKVEMVYLNDSGEVVGLGHSEDAKLTDQALSFRRVFDMKPEQRWLDVDSTIEVVDGRLQYIWRAGTQSGTRVFERAAQ